MTIAQCKRARKRMIERYGDGRRFGWSLSESIERERVKAERQRAATASKKKASK